jgi:hypothetical protein
MSGVLGVHFAITAIQEQRLLTVADDPDAVQNLLENIEETDWYDDEFRAESDKAWDMIHRCLGDGSLDPDAGGYPLAYAILGGRHLHDDLYICYVSAEQAKDVAAALTQIDKAELLRRFTRLPDEHDGPRDFDYTWDSFVDIRELYKRAAQAGRAVLFTAT